MEWILVRDHGEYNPPKVCANYLFAFKGWKEVVYKWGGLRPDGRLFLKEDPEKLVYKKNLIAYMQIDEPKLTKKLFAKYHR